MHENSLNLMKRFLREHAPPLNGLHVLDVGSCDVNGSFRPLFGRAEYIGLDIAPGAGVDLVLEQPYEYPFPDSTFDLAISGSALEHMQHPWRAVAEMARVLNPGGLCCLIAPWSWPIHRYPLDCWRILPDGMQVMLEDANLEVLRCEASENDTYGVGRKPM